jgi:hypothetical protein
LLNGRRIQIRIQEAQKHVDPDSDPDPQHCQGVFFLKDRPGHSTQPRANPAEFKYGNIIEELNFST